MSDPHIVALTVDALLEQVGTHAQDAPTQRMLWEAKNAQKRATRRAFKKLAQKRFSEKLCAAMTQTGLSASQLARKIWGEEKNSRGATAAKNRDRIGLYMKGLSYPRPETMKQLADAIGIPIKELVPPTRKPARGRPASEPVARPARRPAAAGVSLPAAEHLPLLRFNLLEDYQVRLQMDQIMPLDVALEITQRLNTLKSSKTAAKHELQLGSVV